MQKVVFLIKRHKIFNLFKLNSIVKKHEKESERRLGKGLKYSEMRGSKINTTVGLRECLSVHKLQLTSEHTHTEHVHVHV